MSDPAQNPPGEIIGVGTPARPDSVFRLRGGTRPASAGWVLWAAFSLLLTWKAYREHLAHFQPQSVVLLVLTVAAASIVLHILLRRSFVRRITLPVLAGSTLAALLLFEPTALIVTVSVFLACYGTGRFIRERAGLVVSPGSEEIAFSVCLGLALLSWALFWLGLAHLYRTPVFLVLVMAVCVGFRREIKALRLSCESLQRGFVSVLEKNDAAITAGVVFGVAYLAVGLLVVVTPALGPDFLAFHFPLVRFYTAQQALLPLPDLGYSFFPQGVEVLMTFGHVLAGQAAAQMIPPIFFGLLLLLVPPLARELELSASTAALSIVFISALPFLHRTAVFAKNDLALSAFQLGALLCYFRSRHDPDAAWLRLGTLLLAASFAVKHVAVFGAIPIAVLYLRALRRHSRPVREAAILAVLFVAVALPWHTRTFLLTGNPVYPGALAQATEVLGSGADAPAGRSKIGYLLIPLAVLFRGERFFESPSNYPLGILFIVLLGVWLAVRRARRSRVEWACLLFILAYYLYLGAIWPIVRYAIVPIVLLAVMTSGRLAGLREQVGRSSCFLALSAWVYGLFFALLLTLILEVRPGQVEYLTGRISKSQYLDANDERYASLDFIARHAGPDDRIYAVANCASGLAPDPALFRCYPFQDLARAKDSVAQALRRRPHRYLIFPSEPWGDEWVGELTASNDLELVHRDAAFRVYRLGRP